MGEVTIALTLLNGNVWYVSEDKLSSAGISESGISVINQYLRGSRGATLEVNSQADMGGDNVYINVNHISEIEITYN